MTTVEQTHDPFAALFGPQCGAPYHDDNPEGLPRALQTNVGECKLLFAITEIADGGRSHGKYSLEYYDLSRPVGQQWQASRLLEKLPTETPSHLFVGEPLLSVQRVEVVLHWAQAWLHALTS